MEDEGEHERREETAEQPYDSSLLRAEKREQRARVDRGGERPQRPRGGHELVHGDTRRDGEEREQPPASEPQHAEHERQADRRDQQTGGEIGHLPPNLRRRRAYSSIAVRSSSGPKSGQRVSVKTYSAYADCQRRKFEMRRSPDVRMTRSGSGISGWSIFERSQSGARSRRPTNRHRTPCAARSSSSRSIVSPKISISAPTSAASRLQFSVEKA